MNITSSYTLWESCRHWQGKLLGKTWCYKVSSLCQKPFMLCFKLYQWKMNMWVAHRAADERAVSGIWWREVTPVRNCQTGLFVGWHLMNRWFLFLLFPHDCVCISLMAPTPRLVFVQRMCEPTAYRHHLFKCCILFAYYLIDVGERLLTSGG